MNRFKWIPVLLAGGLTGAVCAMAQNGGSAAPSSTAVTYDSSLPDIPFVGAWGGDKPDCSDPHAETECWKCEKSASGFSAFPVPKYWYETTNTCPQLKIKEKTHDECVCELVGTKKTVQVQATADTTDGKWWYVPKGVSGCGKDGPENPIKFKEIRWAWRTYGRPGGDIAKSGDIASFDYDVPNGDVNISVVFKARGIPDYAQCGLVNAGPTEVGTIQGKGVGKLVIPKISTTYPTPHEVTNPPTDGNGNKGWGVLYSSLSNDLDAESVCSASDCEKYRIKGQFYYEADMMILSCLPVTGDNCSLPKGACRKLDMLEKLAVELHEQKHYDAWRTFTDKWNGVVMAAPLFNSRLDADIFISSLLIDYLLDLDITRQRGRSHCPDFDGEVLYSLGDPCGERIPAGRRICP